MNRVFLPALLLLAAGCDAGAGNPSQKATTANLMSAPAAQAPAPALPALTGRIVDQANILSAAAETEIGSRLEALEAKTRDQLVVLTVPSLDTESIEAYALRVANGWGIGDEKLDNGVLLIVAPNDRRTRIAVGIGLEGLLTNEKAKVIVDESLVPNFAKRRYDEGVKAGVAGIIQILESDARRPMPRAVPKAA